MEMRIPFSTESNGRDIVKINDHSISERREIIKTINYNVRKRRTRAALAIVLIETERYDMDNSFTRTHTYVHSYIFEIFR